MKQFKTEREHGFTIVELLVVIVVIAILAAITIVAYSGITAKAKQSRILNDAEIIIKKLEVYKTVSGSNAYPSLPQDWYTQSDLSSSDSVTALPSSIRVVRGTDNGADSSPQYSDVLTGANSSPAVYAFIVCTTGTGGAKVAYPDTASGTIKWYRTGTCP